MIEMHYVESSNVEQIGYDKDASELHVIFHGSTTIYVYLGIPEHVFEEFLSAPSKGSYLHRMIKNVYQFEKR